MFSEHQVLACIIIIIFRLCFVIEKRDDMLVGCNGPTTPFFVMKQCVDLSWLCLYVASSDCIIYLINIYFA